MSDRRVITGSRWKTREMHPAVFTVTGPGGHGYVTLTWDSGLLGAWPKKSIPTVFDPLDRVGKSHAASNIPTVTKCSGCDQERDLGATGKCWDCYVVQEKVMTVSQLAYDQAKAAEVETIKRTTMLAGFIDPLWQRNPNVGVWRLR